LALELNQMGSDKKACKRKPGCPILLMALPNTPVTLTVEQIATLSQKLSTMRHDINNHLALIVAAAELIRLNPDMLRKMANTLADEPPKITDQISKFSAEFEKALGINH
jgi:hypothetical protein